jgi:hypothetical protein
MSMTDSRHAAGIIPPHVAIHGWVVFDKSTIKDIKLTKG